LSNTLYDILEVSPNASAEVIHSTYRALAQRFHPDKNVGDPAATDLMAEINRAYAILSDPLKRNNYDASLSTAPQPWPSYHEANPDSRRSSSSRPPTKSDHKDDRTAPYLLMKVFLVVGLMIVIAMVVYLVLFYINDDSVAKNAALRELRELVESIQDTKRDAR
jgi:hypothetical protein